MMIKNSHVSQSPIISANESVTKKTQKNQLLSQTLLYNSLRNVELVTDNSKKLLTFYIYKMKGGNYGILSTFIWKISR